MTDNYRVTHMLYLPDTMTDWPWQRAINPLHEEVKEESNTWLKSFNPFDERSQYAFDKCDFGKLAALAYPHASRDHLRTGCDLMNLVFVIDEYTDIEPALVVRQMADIIIDALENPYKSRPEGETILGEITRQFWERAIRTATSTSQKHFIESFKDYLESVVDEAQDRDNNHIRTIDSYLQNRRQNIGTRPAYVPAELDLNIPDEAFYHPVVMELSYCIADLVILDNDLTSYNKEQASGNDHHNIITVAMHQFNTDIEGAISWLARHHKEVEAKFLEGMKTVPSFGPEVDRQLKLYLDRIAMWPRTNDCWTFESGRYFGSKAPEVQKTRMVPMLPKTVRDPTLKVHEVVVQLIEI